MAELSLREAIYSLRAMRRLRPDPVPESELRFVVDAATRAASARNQQPWAFVVVTDPEPRRRLAEIYLDLARRFIRDGSLADPRLPEGARRIDRRALALAERLGEAPALVLALMRGRPPREPAAASAWYGSIYPAVQNLMLAARSRGLGTTLTTLHKAREGDVKALLGVPDGWETIALIPIGYPAGDFAPPRREPAWRATHWQRWGHQIPWE